MEKLDLTKLTREELAERLLDAMKRGEKATYALNKERFDEMLFAVDELKDLLFKNNPNTTIKWEFRYGIKTTADIIFETEEVAFFATNMDRFKKVVNLADGFETHPLKNEKLSGSLMFKNVAQKIK